MGKLFHNMFAILVFLLLSSTDAFAQVDDNTKAISYYKTAQDLYNEDKFDDAINVLNEAISILGKSTAKIQYLLAKSHINKQNWSKAKTELDNYFEVASETEKENPRYEEMTRQIAVVDINLKKYKERAIEIERERVRKIEEQKAEEKLKLQKQQEEQLAQKRKKEAEEQLAEDYSNGINIKTLKKRKKALLDFKANNPYSSLANDINKYGFSKGNPWYNFKRYNGFGFCITGVSLIKRDLKNESDGISENKNYSLIAAQDIQFDWSVYFLNTKYFGMGIYNRITFPTFTYLSSLISSANGQGFQFLNVGSSLGIGFGVAPIKELMIEFYPELRFDYYSYANQYSSQDYYGIYTDQLPFNTQDVSKAFHDEVTLGLGLTTKLNIIPKPSNHFKLYFLISYTKTPFKQSTYNRSQLNIGLGLGFIGNKPKIK